MPFLSCLAISFDKNPPAVQQEVRILCVSVSTVSGVGAEGKPSLSGLTGFVCCCFVGRYDTVNLSITSAW
jgi:hypothetical protein